MSEPFYEKLYRYLREGRAATNAWNEAYLERNGLKPLLQRLEAGEIKGLGDFGGGSAAEPKAAAAAAASGSMRAVDDASVRDDAAVDAAVGGDTPVAEASVAQHAVADVAPANACGPAPTKPPRPKPARAIGAQLDLFPAKGAAR